MKSLAYDIVRTTQQAALAAWPLLGCSDKNQIDGAAVAAMRHHRQQAQALGVKIFAIPDGDVAASLMTCLPNGEADIMYTLGGAPEGVISACAVRLLGGDMQAELIDFCQAKGETPQHRVWAQEEHRRCRNMGIEINSLLSLNDMIASDEVIFSATGITQGDIVGGIKQKEGYLSTETLIINGTDGSCNRIQTLHLH